MVENAARGWQRRISFACIFTLALWQSAPAFAMSHGEIVVDPEEAPWVVALTIPTLEGTPATDRLKCGGVLITANKVLTSAHCAVTADSFSLDPSISPRPMHIGSVEVTRANRALNNENPVSRMIVAVHVDPDFHLLASPLYPHDPSRAAARHDLAVLVLDRPFDNPHLIIPLAAAPFPVGTKAHVYGHGLTPIGNISDELLRGDLTVMSNKQCDEETFVELTYIGAMCAQTTELPENSVQVGFGDSGGPLVVENSRGDDVLVGITSFGTETTGKAFSYGFNAFADVGAAEEFISLYAPEATWVHK